MLVYEYKLAGHQKQHGDIEHAIGVLQLIRNKCLRQRMDERGVSKNDLPTSCAVLARECPLANSLNSQSRQARADRAWFAIERFYEHCKEHKPGKKGYPKFQHDNRSVEYKQTGWKVEPDGRHITFTDGCGIGRLRLVGNPKQQIETFPTKQIKRVPTMPPPHTSYLHFTLTPHPLSDHTSTGKQVGIDVGLKSFLTDSAGKTVDN